jgi:hypothetical protein
MNLSRLFFLTIMIPFASLAQQMEKVKVADALNTFQFEIPVDFFQMSEADKSAKLESYRRSIAAYTDRNRETDFGINRAFSKFQEEDLSLLQEFYRSTIMNLYNVVSFEQDTIREINGRRFVVFEFDSEVNDDERTFSRGQKIQKYAYVMYTIVNDNTVVLNFQSPLREKRRWKDTARQIMNSVVIK